mmetsp:Transcript_19887/g.30291  ORF Transcript_19887/g.30291 Transcript_19887/m.30291 type:complete len:224 (+) Transcript_19887:40-711(+)
MSIRNIALLIVQLLNGITLSLVSVPRSDSQQKLVRRGNAMNNQIENPRMYLKEAFFNCNRTDKDQILDDLCQLSPALPDTALDGRWRVAYAPHISKLGSVLFTNFDQIIYDIGPQNQITSHVHYSTIGNHEGWLSTRGTFEFNGFQSSVKWYDIWWDPSAQLPSNNDGAYSDLIQSIGRLAFIDTFAHFPVQYLDANLCVFLFPLFGTRIAAIATDKCTTTYY